MRWLARLLGVRFKGAAEAPAPAQPVVTFSPFVYFNMEDFIKPVAHLIREKNPSINDTQRAWNIIGDVIARTPGAVENGISAVHIGSTIRNLAGCLPHYHIKNNHIVIDRHVWNKIFEQAKDVGRCVKQFEAYDMGSATVVSMDIIPKLKAQREADPRFNPARDAGILKPFFEAFQHMDRLHRATPDLLAAPQTETADFSRMAP